MPQTHRRIARDDEKAVLPHVVCWTRMQAESGQEISSIVARKELERQAGNGLFFWGVGNAPSRSLPELVACGQTIQVVFSLMKSKPKPHDANPSSVMVWGTYFDMNEVECPLPSHVLITSRGSLSTTPKKRHYALVCESTKELTLDGKNAFDPTAFRNLSGTGGPIGNSQVTALVIRKGDDSNESTYRINFSAMLTGSYWVKLGQPRMLNTEMQNVLERALSRCSELSHRDWLKVVTRIKRGHLTQFKSQSLLFE